MIAVVGNKKKEISIDDFKKIAGKYSAIEVDLGTGDGRFVFKNALFKPNTLFVGIDPAEKQLEIYSKKTNKEKLTNALFILGSLENIPNEILWCANILHITLPWGTLLESVIKPNKKTLLSLKDILKENAVIEIIFGYVPELEPTETKRLNLPTIDLTYIKDSVVPTFERSGFVLNKLEELSKNEIGKIETTWAKKLKFGRDRKIFKLNFSLNFKNISNN